MKEFKVERRKMTLNTKQLGQEFASSAKTPDKGKQKFLRLMLRDNAQMQLLPWSTLAMRYEIGSVQLWYTKYSKAPQLIITENGRRPSTNHYNIKLFKLLPVGLAIPCNIIRCLTNKTVPLGKSPDQIVLALEYNNRFWKICGICQKDDSSGDSLSMSLIDDYYSVEDSEDEQPPVIDLDEDDDNEELAEAASDDTGEQDDSTVAVVHENVQGNKKTIYCSRRRLNSMKLRSANTVGWNIEHVLCASIPSVTLACKWRVICMNLGFAYLSLLRSNYTIKYDDLMKAVKLAQTEKKTIVLKSKELQKNYPHSSFGIYCVHDYWDKIFVGPYFVHEDHDLDTLRFVNGMLVNTDLFNQRKGKNIPGSGFWFNQMTDSEHKSIDDDVTFVQYSRGISIDLTCDSDDEVLGEVVNSPTPKQNDKEEIANMEKALDALLTTGQLNVNQMVASNVVRTSQSQAVPTVNSATSELAKSLIGDRIHCDSGYDADDEMVVEKISQGDSNRSKQIGNEIEIERKDVMYNTDESKRKYILTNIPTMGYIVTYHYENYVDVMYPIKQKIRRFHTAEIAVTAVEGVLSKQFILTPSTFKLECRFAERVEDNVGPLDSAILNGYHIAGAFGVKKISACTVSVLRDLGMDRNELTQTLLHRKLHPMSELARLLKIPMTAEPLSECLSNILEGARKEIDILQKERDSLANETLSLEAKRNLLTERYSKLIADLPPEQQSKVQEDVLDVPGKSDSSSLDLISNEEDDQFAMDDPIELLDDSDEADTNVPRVSCSATITSAPKGVVTSSTFPKINCNYIAVQEGNETKYFQIASSDNDCLRMNPLQAVKRSGSGVVTHLSAKKCQQEHIANKP